MLSRRTQWIISAVGLVVLLAYYGWADDDEADGDAMDTAAPLAVVSPPAAASRAPAAAALPALDASRFTRAPVQDEDGSLAHEVAVPEGWQMVGGVRWNDATGCPGLMMLRTWTVIGPDSLTTIGVVPGYSWQHAGTQIPTSACPVAPFRTVREFLQASVQQMYPQGRELDYQDTSAQYQAQMQKLGLDQQQNNGRPPPAREAGKILVGYRDEGGVPMEAILEASMDTNTFRGNVLSTVSNILVHGAPQGRLNPRLVERVLAESGAPDPQWVARFQQRMQRNMQRYFSQQSQQIDQWHQRQMALINARGMADRQAIRMRTNKEVAGIYSAIAASSSATSDRMHSRTLEGIGEYNTYSGVGGSTVQSSIHGGDRVFQSQSDPGSAYSTNAPYGAAAPGYVELQRR